MALTIQGIDYHYGETLDTCVAKGTWTASGTWTIPAVTLGGAVAGGGQSITSLAGISFSTSTALTRTVDTDKLSIMGGTDIHSGQIDFYGKSHGTYPGLIVVGTPNNALAQTNRLTISGAVDTAVLTLSAVTVTGMAITNASFINAANGADGDYFTIGARDSDTDAIVEVARVFGAADPYFSFGGSQQFKFYNSGVADFGAVTLGGAVTGNSQNITGVALLRVSAGASGQATLNGLLTVEDDTDANVSITVPANKTSAYVFGSPTSATRAYVGYNHSTDTMYLGIADGVRLNVTSSTFAFAQSTTLSTSSGTLTLSAVTLGGAVTGGGQIISNVGGLTVANAGYLNAFNNADGDYFTIGARDSDTDAIVEVARVFGAADPYFSFGSSQQIKFLASGTVTGLVITNDVGIRALDVGGTSRYLIGLGGDNEVYLANDAAGGINLRTDNDSGVGNLVTRLSISNGTAAVLSLSSVTVTGTVITNAASINAANAADGNYFTIGARDSDTDAIVEVARVFGAADPYFSAGGSQQNKFYNSGKAELGGPVGTGAAGSLTISVGGAIAVTKVYHTVVVNGGTGSGADDLSTATGGAEGDLLILKAATSGAADTVTVKNGTGAGTFILAGDADFVMDHIDDRIMLIHNGTEWVEISRSANS